MVDKSPTPKEIDPKVELVHQALDHLHLISDMFGMKAAEQNQQPLGKNLERLSILIDPENLDIDTVNIYQRVIRETEVEKYRFGEDPGVWFNITTKNGMQINVNIHGGLRRVGEMDTKQSVGLMNAGKASSAITDSNASQPTEININVLDQGMIIHDFWFSVSPKLVPPNRKGASISSYNTKSFVEEGIFCRYDSDETRGIIEQLRASRPKLNG